MGLDLMYVGTPTLFVSLNSLARLHFPVTGISFLGPCFSFLSRIPQDSCGFLFFPEEFFTGTSFWLDFGIPNYSGISGILRNSCSRQRKLPWFERETMASERRWRDDGPYHGLWWTYALDPVYRRDPDITGDAAICWVEGIRPPQPERNHYFGGDFLYAYITRIINKKLNLY